MIEINLLPIEFREKKKILLEELFQKKLLLVILGCLILLHLFLVSINFINAKRLKRLTQNWQALSFKIEKITQLKAELERINKHTPLIEQLTSKRILWTKKLNRISDLMIEGVWLNEISLQREIKKEGQSLACLIIRGSAASRAKDEPALIGRFMQNLKDDPVFFIDFSDIELGPMKKRQIAQTEIMDFILICWFKLEGA